MNNDPVDELAHVLKVIEEIWLKGTVSSVSLPSRVDEQRRVEQLLSDLKAIQDFTLALSNGDLSQTLLIKGRTAGSLKALQASLRHLTWQTKMVAQGDFSQRVDFMGEFAQAFNIMIKNLEEARSSLQQQATELAQMNTRLREEVEERTRAEAAVRQANAQLQKNLHEIQSLQVQLQEQAIRDPLTNLFNRRYLRETLERELAEAGRSHHQLSVSIMDIDFFKKLNDTYGHAAGDLMLQALSQLLHQQTRQADVVCRYGGEEFVIVMPDAPLDGARQRAEQLRSNIESLKVDFADKVLHATISIGIAAFPRHGHTSDELLRAADQALYTAKEAGRNRVVVQA